MSNFPVLAEKNKIRQQVLLFRKKLSENIVSKKSEIIQEKVINFLSQRKFNNFLVYLPVNNEVKTDKIIDYLFKKGKKVYLPAFIEVDGDWKLAEFESWQNLQKGPFNILQPKNPKVIKGNQLDVAIVPGVAFDNQGTKLGYGKGVYDKLLGDFNNLKIGLAYDFQIVDNLPQEKHDLVMDIISTELGDYSISQ